MGFKKIMKRKTKKQIQKFLLGSFLWFVALLFFLPIVYIIATGFKSEAQAIENPVQLFFTPTLESYSAIFERANYFKFAYNSIVVSMGSTIMALLIGIPCAYSMVFYRTRRTPDILVWMLSTKMLPTVGVLVPIYLIFKNLHALDTLIGLAAVYTLMNLPIVIWLLYSYFREIPADILEASKLDGANFWKEIRYILIPLSSPGIASTSLLSIILSWNEAFWSINLTSTQAATLTAFIASFSSPEGLFWSKLSAASTLAILPILILGWLTQKSLVRGLTFGAVK